MQFRSLHSDRSFRGLAWWFPLFAAAVAGLFPSGGTLAAQQIRFRMIDGKPCAACTLHGPRKSIPANVVIDLGSRVPLLVHRNTARLLQIGGDTPAELRFGDLVLAELGAVAVDLPSLDELSKEHAPELGEIPAVAIVGLPAFHRYVVQLEVGQGTLGLLSPSEAGEPPAGEPENASKVASFSYEERAYGYWLTAVAPDDFRLRTRFMTSAYDTVIDAVAADLAGSAAGAIDRLHLGGINIARFVALRPEDLSGLPEPRADLLIGTNLLSSFRVTIDPARRRMTFEQTAEPRFPVEERAYFEARAAGDAGGMERFLEAHSASRLAAEAAGALLALRLDEEPGDRDAIRRAIGWRAVTTPENRRSMAMVTLADELIAGRRADRHDLARDALQAGMPSAPADLNGVAAFHIHARLGLIALRLQDRIEARRRLLSAAFGLPRDPLVNLWLGELYEQSGKPVRAWSRFVQSALDRHAPPEALAGLDRLNRDPQFRAAFSMADAEQLLEGRVVEFHPADRFEPPGGGGAGPPVRLVELFTSIDEPSTSAPQLAFDGLRQYFEEAPVVLIQYHLASPAADPLVSAAGRSRAAFYGTTTAPAAFFDGQGPVTAAGTDQDAAGVYAEYLKAALASQPASGGWTIRGQAVLSGETIAATVTLAGPPAAESLRLHVVLCEKAVMVPGANAIVLHRNVARARLSPEEGFMLPAADGERSFDVQASVGEIVRSLEHGLAELEEQRKVSFLMKPTLVDGRAAVLAAFLQDRNTRRVETGCAIEVAADRKPPP